MDTCSRLGEPGGVEWKDVHVGRLRTTISGKPLIWWLRADARSDRWPRNLGCAILCCGAGGDCVGLGRVGGGVRGGRWVGVLGGGGGGWVGGGVGREPTAAARRPTTQATLP